MNQNNSKANDDLVKEGLTQCSNEGIFDNNDDNILDVFDADADGDNVLDAGRLDDDDDGPSHDHDHDVKRRFFAFGQKST